ncbi:MAG: phosphotransferase [Bacteriovorax sp.]|nr:phosphotransferase [Bacteriovorax sp.]
MMLTDLHIHSNFSDGKLSIPEIVDFYGPRGFNIIAITDHLCEEETFLGKASKVLNKTLTKNNFQQYLDLIKSEGSRAMKKYGMLVIAGVELTKNSLSFHRSAHILAIGITKYISADGTIPELIAAIKNQGALAIAAHPVSTKKVEHQTYHLWDEREELKNLFDAWEVASGPHLFEEVMNSGLPMIANSDFHNEKHIRSWKSLINCEKNFKSLSAAVKNQQLEFTFYEEAVHSRFLTRISLNHSGSSSGRSCPAVG